MTRRLLHLLWIAPVAVLIDVYCLVIANIERCGVFGCSGPLASPSPGAVVVVIILSGLATAALVMFVPWQRSRIVRGVVAVLGAAASWTFVASQYAG